MPVASALRALLGPIALHAFLGFAGFGLLGRLVVELSAGGGPVAAVGATSLSLLLTLLGFVGGAVHGAATGAERVTLDMEAELARWLASIDPGEGRALVPPVEVAALRGGYETTLDRLVDASIGRLPLPDFVFRFARERFRHYFVEDFLADFDEAGVTTIRFPELRDWAIARGVPYATAPVHLRLSLARRLVRGLGVLVAGGVLGWAVLAAV